MNPVSSYDYLKAQNNLPNCGPCRAGKPQCKIKRKLKERYVPRPC